MSVRIGHARSDEDSNTKYGNAGDQTGREVSVSDYYVHSKGWVVLRCKDASKREKIAQAMEMACNNKQIGYDQTQRNTLFENVKNKGFDPSKTTKNVETDCSALVRVCIAYAYGTDKTGSFRTISEPDILVNTGLFIKYTSDKYCKSSDYLLRGDILCTATKGHTVVVLDNGAKVKVSTTTQNECKKEQSSMKLVKDFTTKNPCYKSNVNKVDSRYTNFQKNGPKGLMLHSIGVGQNKASIIMNNFNQTNASAAVHAVLQEDGTVIQCMPWNYRAWHCGGSANNTHIGIEMTEPNCIKYTGGSSFTCSDLTKARAQVLGTYKTAVDLFAYLCKMHNLDPLKDGVIISHAEGCKRGVASNHGDPEHLWKQLKTGYTMDGFRKDVKAAMSGTSVNKVPVVPTVPSTSSTMYRVRKSWANVESQIGAYSNLANAKKACDEAGSDYFVFDANGKVVYPISDTSYIIKVNASVLNVRKGPGTSYDITSTIKNGGIYTIVEENNGWGRLKSGAGWISLDYVKKVQS